MEKKAIVYIYKRKLEKKDEDTLYYTCELYDVIKGTEIDISDNKVFVSECGNFNYPIANDIYNMDEQFIYAFPYYIDNLSPSKQALIEKQFKEDADFFEKNLLLQMFVQPLGHVETFISTADLDTYKSVNPDDYDEIAKAKEFELDEPNTIDDLVKEDEKQLQHTTEKTESTKPKLIYTDDIYQQVRKVVICQDEQIKAIATAIAKNQRIQDPRLKSNILVCGPTATGKTEIFRIIKDIANLPISMEDSTEYTAASYKGKDADEMLIHLYEQSGRNLEAAQKGIIIIDEIDKKVSKAGNETYSSAVIHSLLKMMEGHTYALELNDRNRSTIYFDTSHLTFALLGAFSGIEEEKIKRHVGFQREEPKEPTTKDIYTHESLIKYGLMPEFVGRNDTIVVMNSLDVPEYIRIMKESEKNHLLLYKKFFETNGINFIYDDKTIETIAEYAKKLGIGARGIKTIVERALSVANYYALSSSKYKELIITPETIEDNKKFILR